MASLTKEQLRNELISHGVELPASSARKEELVRLYETYVSPIASMKGDFSSDEENDIIEIDSKASSVPEVTEVVTVADLSDEQLYDELVARGVSVGPIVDSTRAIYQRKLIALLSEPGAIGAVNGSSSDQFSDSEGEPEPEIPAPATPAPATPAPPTPAPEPVSINDFEPCSEPVTPVVYVREDSPARPPSVAAAASVPESEPIPSIRSRFADLLPPASPLAALPLVDRQGTPTPRPSIRSFSTTSSYSYDSSRRFMDATDSAAAAPSQATGQAPKNKWTRYIIAITVAALAAIIAYTVKTSP